MNQTTTRSTSKQIAFVILMAASANILALFVLPIGVMSVHFIQIPIILTGFVLGPVAGGLVGFAGATSMALTLPRVNPYILLGNAILGAFTGLFYGRIRKSWRRPLVPQILSALGACMVQFPYVYVTDVYLMGMPQPVVMVIIVALFVEDLISIFISHVILNRIDVSNVLK